MLYGDVCGQHGIPELCVLRELSHLINTRKIIRCPLKVDVQTSTCALSQIAIFPLMPQLLMKVKWAVSAGWANKRIDRGTELPVQALKTAFTPYKPPIYYSLNKSLFYTIRALVSVETEQSSMLKWTKRHNEQLQPLHFQPRGLTSSQCCPFTSTTGRRAEKACLLDRFFSSQ